jgi:ATP/ADP translocase
MKQKNFWLRTLNIRSEEGWLVKKLFLLQFFQGAGIAFFFTAAFALFLSKYAITELPYVFIYSSLLLWIVGFIYSRAEHKFEINNFAIIVTVFMLVSMLFFRVAFDFIQADWFLYGMLAWFNVLYLLNNLEFWGVASLLFDARQSKRLFGVISAGDIPAKFIGYTLALFTVEYIGTINLLIIGAACLVASIPFLLSIKKSGYLQHEHHIHHKPAVHATHKVGKIVKNVAENTLIRRLATLSIIVSGCFIMINFAFYAGVKEAYTDDVSLAQFIAFFLAIVRIIAMIIKTLVTGRLISRLGITKSLLITPVTMIILVTIVILTQNLAGYQKIIIYLFGVTSITVDILRSSINSPVFLTVMQPLPNHERLRAHTIVKGIMDPFASLLTGVVLLAVIYFQHKVDLLTLSYILLSAGILWIAGIYRVNNQYLKTVIKTISNRYFNQDNFLINDEKTLEWLKQKVRTSSETEVINILNMLYSNTNSLSDELLLAALEHSSEKVAMTALTLKQQTSFPTAATILLPYLTGTSNEVIRAECIKIMCSNGINNELIKPYLDSPVKGVRMAALGGLLYYGSTESKTQVKSILRKMSFSEDAAERIMVAEVLGMQANSGEIAIILQLMNDHNPMVSRAGFLAAGKNSNALLLQELINRIDSHEIDILHALSIAGERALPVVYQYITGPKASRPQKEKLILLCGRIDGALAQETLLKLLSSLPEEQMVTVKALYRNNFEPKPADQVLLVSIAKKMLSRSAGIIYMHNSLAVNKEKYHLLINAFNLELNALRDSLLYLFALMYDREHINKVRTAYATEKKESIINAMEIIDISVRKDLGGHFNTIFEPCSMAERLNGLRKIYPMEFFTNVEQVLTVILEDDQKSYNNWTVACCLYTTKKQHHNIDKNLIKKYTLAENIMVKETAYFAL